MGAIRIFRDRYDARRLLREVAEEVRTANSLEYEAPRVVARIEAALHPEFAALMVREPHENFYYALAAAPSSEGPPSLPKDTKLVALIRLLGKPLKSHRLSPAGCSSSPTKTRNFSVLQWTTREGHLRLRHQHQLNQNKAGRSGGPAGIRTPDQGIMSTQGRSDRF